MTLETDLRVASDRMMRTLDQMVALENEKRALKPESERFQRLAAEVERLAADVFAQTHQQQQLGERAQTIVERTGSDIDPIDAQEPTRELQVILSEWRDAERRLSLADPDSAEHGVAVADVSRLREEYHRSYSAGMKNGRQAD